MITGVLKPLYNTSYYKWLVFSAVGLGSLTNVIHHGSVGIALPTIAQTFNVPLTTIQWVVLAESLTISAMLLPIGRLSDIVGRKSVFLIGVLLFGSMALLAGSSPWLSELINLSTPITLMIVFRVFQGLGAAMTQATGMAMVTSVFSNEERGKGLGAHGSVIGTGGVIGPILGGLLITYVGWQWIFWINVPLCAITFVVTTFLLDSSRFNRGTSSDGQYDWLGASLSTAVLLTFLLTLSNGTNLGWTALPIMAGIAAFLVALVLFIWVESRSEHPMLNLTLFRTREFSIGTASNYLSFLGVSSFRFVVPFYLQSTLLLNPAQVAYVLIPNAVNRIVLGPITGNLSDKFGRKIFTTTGLAFCGAGLYMMAFMGHETSVWYVIAAILVFSAGSGIFLPANSAGIFSAASGKEHGVVSALVNLSRNSGNVTGIAVSTAIVAGVMMSNGYTSEVAAVMESGKGSELLDVFISGMRLVFILMASFQVISSFAHLATRKRG